MKSREYGQTTVFFTLILTGLLLLTAVGIEIGRIVYARGEVGKAADAAALAAASRIDVVLYRETGEIRFLPDVYDTAQTYATLNSSYLASHSIFVTVTGISIDEGSQTVSVSVTANLSALLPSLLDYKRQFIAIGYAKGKLDGR